MKKLKNFMTRLLKNKATPMERLIIYLAVGLCLSSCNKSLNNSSITGAVSKEMVAGASEYISKKIPQVGDYHYCDFGGHQFWQIKDLEYKIIISEVAVDKSDSLNGVVERAEIYLECDFDKNPVYRNYIDSSSERTEWSEFGNLALDSSHPIHFKGVATQDGVKFSPVVVEYYLDISDEKKSIIATQKIEN